ncbi:AraC family transcriptional regulator [Aliagarivorans marinus]|uniref:AraC family transcriptional regulator n=1 Tax=Aliagarivorans marinus TaxID=561965 RepID=UPI0004056552|nr:AraC family transcriptional regulator [Aliagarivorans marinus]
MPHLYRRGFIHVIGNAKRQLASKQLHEIGYFPNKPFTLSYTCKTINFSFLLSGEGSYQVNGQDVAVTGPCVLVQLPGENYVYGPNQRGRWEEFYLIYHPDALQRLRGSQIIVDGQFSWPINNIFAIEEAINAMVKAVELNLPTDVIDQHCEMLLVLSKMPKERDHQDKAVAAINAIAAAIKHNCQSNYSFQEIAEELGMSYSSFRRYWVDIFGVSPKNFQMDQRMVRAANLIISTNSSIAQVAESVGYDDQAYFSTLFKKRYKMSPAQYRKQHVVTIPAEYLGPSTSCEQEAGIVRSGIVGSLGVPEAS